MKQLSLFSTPEHSKDSKPKKTVSKVTIWKVFIDGAARNNPGPAGAGIVIKKNGRLVSKHGYYLGPRTNNQAEYYALLLGLFLLQKHLNESDMVTIISDSLLLVKQFKGEYKIKHPELKPLHSFAQTLLVGVHCIFEHVMREDNTEADAMANHGIDERVKLPEQFKKLLTQHGIT